MYKLKQVINLLIVPMLVCLTFTASSTNVDPTKPFGQSNTSSSVSVKEQTLILQSIIHGDGIHTAVINGKVIKPGEYISQYRLVAINDESVVLRSDDERLKLYIFKQSVLK